MSAQKCSFPHILKHVASGKWLELWIDGWYLVDDANAATRHYDVRQTKEKIIPAFANIFYGGQVEMVFLDKSE